MRPSRFTDAEIAQALRDVREGETAAAACRRLGITHTTFYRWRARLDADTAGDARRMRELEEENRRLKQLVADLMLQTRPGGTRARRRK